MGSHLLFLLPANLQQGNVENAQAETTMETVSKQAPSSVLRVLILG